DALLNLGGYMRTLLHPQHNQLYTCVPPPNIQCKAPAKSRAWRSSMLYSGMPTTQFPFSNGCPRYRVALRLLLRCYDSIRCGIQSATILVFKNWLRKRNSEGVCG